MPGPLNYRLKYRRLNGTHDIGGDTVLQIEDIGKIAVILLGPQMAAGRGLEQLGRDAHAFARFPDAAFEYIAHAEFPADPLRVRRLALV